jgi:hypothetical protein
MMYSRQWKIAQPMKSLPSRIKRLHEADIPDGHDPLKSPVSLNDRNPTTRIDQTQQFSEHN